ncbi:TrkA C-terminal domain-containing protein [Caldinitratiruptor microaerophilus]|uniref:Transcriptional regulator n=1 Tax=Caldinitratiruptor microaerophilus TaxID=671077 RepID=A0AA35CJI0_9FIRM|nr:TrkA C-terminal domain-containing protein [Caldinitratiruptor microaerophilus]BDG59619.1 transcriptional regulator [Caldinitratiruptor microaerophilus]
MSKRERPVPPRYEEIAVDLARRIVDYEYREGERVLGRSHLAGTYKVSPETVRRAIAILHDRGVVRAVPGSGIRIVSRQAAVEYLESLRTRSAIVELQEQVADLLAQRREIDEKLEDACTRLAALAGRALAAARRVEEVTIPAGSWLAGRTLGESRLRNISGATVIAVVRGTEEYYSPSPDFTFAAGDLLLIVGPETARERLEKALALPEPPPGAVSTDGAPVP